MGHCLDGLSEPHKRYQLDRAKVEWEQGTLCLPKESGEKKRTKRFSEECGGIEGTLRFSEESGEKQEMPRFPGESGEKQEMPRFPEKSGENRECGASPRSLVKKQGTSRFPDESGGDEGTLRSLKESEVAGGEGQERMDLLDGEEEIDSGKPWSFEDSVKEEVESVEFRCRKCRFALFTDVHVILHVPFERTCTSVFVQPMNWMGNLTPKTGKLVCICGAKLGNYSWFGVACSCSVRQAPGFQLHLAKLDQMPMV